MTGPALAGAGPAAAARPKVLLVDDDPRILAGLRRQLHQRFQVATAVGGMEALEAITAEDDFAVVVSDMRMPGMDGAALLARVRIASPRSTRVLLTGQTELSAAVRAIDDGQIFRFLSKPCPPEVLEKCLQEAVVRHRATLDEFSFPPGSVGDRRVMELDGRGDVVAAGRGTGLQQRQFRLQYQPIVALGSGCAIGVEATARRLDPAGVVAPVTGAVRGPHLPLGRWMTAAACQEVASWPATTAEPLRVHLRLYPGHLDDPRLVDDIAQTLILSGLEPHRLTLEMPPIVAGVPAGATRLRTISLWGVRLALVIDDLEQALAGIEDAMPFDAVRMSLRGAVHDGAAPRAVAFAAETVRRMAVPAIAGDLDCAECLEAARGAGCEFGQGPQYGPPADPGDLLPGLVAGRP